MSAHGFISPLHMPVLPSLSQSTWPFLPFPVPAPVSGQAMQCRLDPIPWTRQRPSPIPPDLFTPLKNPSALDSALPIQLVIIFIFHKLRFIFLAVKEVIKLSKTRSPYYVKINARNYFWPPAFHS